LDGHVAHLNGYPCFVMWKFALVVGALLLAGYQSVAVAQDHYPESGYLDDRSTPEGVINSYWDAVNKREYARAYSYWEAAAADRELPPFHDFASGYEATTSVQVTLGTIRGDVGAGQLYFSVPVTLLASAFDGSLQTFVGCYTLHLGRPQLQAEPPFQPMAIQHAKIVEVDNDASTSELMARACAG
jgi:hypothetical protein